jgi:hypothetical protein
MLQQLFFVIGRWIGKHPNASFLIFGCVVVGIAINAQTEGPTGTAAVQTAAVMPVQVDPRIEACGTGMESRRANAKAAFKNKDFEGAYQLMDYCSSRMDKNSADYKDFLQYATAKTQAFNLRTAQEARAEKARRKKEGVSIGMDVQQVLDSSWGRPEHVNRTTTAYGTREQWVYGSRSYLYFENGTLISIQN